jgi:hypothetical protein
LIHQSSQRTLDLFSFWSDILQDTSAISLNVKPENIISRLG